MRRAERLLAACALCLPMIALAQLAADDPDWKETDVPPPPAFDAGRTVRVEGPPSSSLTLGVDPATVTVTPDGVVRYVLVARNSSGGMNVMYEGIRCATGQYRLYARHSGGEWRPVTGGDWISLQAPMPSKHPLILARSGMCEGRAPLGSAADIVRTLRYPPQPRN